LLKTLRDELVEILYRREVEVIETTSLTFDPAIQRAIGTELASVETEHNQIAKEESSLPQKTSRVLLDTKSLHIIISIKTMAGTGRGKLCKKLKLGIGKMATSGSGIFKII
jgi:hypothetical protein